MDVAYDGESGYDLASVEGYDVIILDLMLPKLDGLEVCKRLREERNHTPILMLTAKGEIGDKVLGLNAGADDYLSKPFAFSELLARVKALARRPKNVLSTILKVGDLSVDTINFKVIRAGSEIKLSKKEYGLLEYLIRQKGRTLSKDQIANHVWDYDADILPNTIEVYIGYLRNKINKPFKDKPALIETVRGFGYRIKDSDE